jgi:hypothetical protein
MEPLLAHRELLCKLSTGFLSGQCPHEFSNLSQGAGLGEHSVNWISLFTQLLA